MSDFKIEFDSSGLEKSLQSFSKKGSEVSKKVMADLVDDLATTSTDTAPIKRGTLRRSETREIGYSKEHELEGILTFSVHEGDFNYAKWIHEGAYDLGDDSRMAPGGSGMSGKSYPVGNKFVERVLNGERETYFKYYAEHVRKGVFDL